MAERRSLVIVGSEVVELPSGDALLAHAIDRGNGFVSWTGEATVTPSTSVALVDSTGALLSPTKTYKVAACNIDSSVQRGAVALFVGDGSSFTLKTVYEQGTTSSNVQLYLDAGVPSVSVYGGSGTYRIPYRIEEVPNFGQALSEFGILQRLLDAPSDGTTYGRKDGAWVAAGGGGGGIIVETQDSNYTFVATDAGRCKTRSSNNASVTYTIPASTFSAGDVLYVNFMGTANMSYYTTITRASGVTLYRSGTTTSVTSGRVYGGGMATIFFVSTNVAIYGGPGVN